MNQLIRFVLIFGLLASILFSSTIPALAKDPMRIGVLPVVDTLPLLVAQENGFFQSKGLEVELVSFQSALERDAALQAGRLDGYFGDILNTVLLVNSGQKLKIITTVYHSHTSHRMFGLVSSPGSKVEKIDGLKAKEVAISRATIIEYLLDRFVKATGHPSDFVKKQEIKKMPIRLQLLLADQVPAALLPEPLLTLAESKGATVLVDDRILDTSLTVLTVKEPTNPAGRERIQEFLKAYRQAVDAINRNPEAFKDLLMTRTRFPMPIKDRYRVPVFPSVAVPPEADIMAVQSWLIQKKMMRQPVPYKQIVFIPYPFRKSLMIPPRRDQWVNAAGSR